MSISIFGTPGAAFANNASVNAPLGGTTVANDIAIAYGAFSAGVSVSIATPSGYTQDAVSGNGSASPTYAYHKTAGAGESNPSMVPTGGSAGNPVGAIGLILRGVNTSISPVLAGQTTSTASNSTPISTPALTVANNNSLVLALVAYTGPATSFGSYNPNGAGAWSSALAFTVQTYTTSLSFQLFYLLQTTATNITASTVSIAGSASGLNAHAILSVWSPLAASVLFRKTLSGIGGRIGARQLQS